MSYNISMFLPYYPSISSPDFNTEIYQKQEFRVPEVETLEYFPVVKGDLMAHQVIISRMLSSHTPYDGILLLHEMGTGKTCGSIAILEQIRSENNGFNQFIYVCSSDALRENFKSEFKGVCTKGDYEDVNLCSKKIFTMTYNGFLKKFKGTKFLENAVVIIDEVHNIRRTSSVFGEILKSGRNVKSILMSGTPMTDSPSGIAYVMNMILPDDKKLPVNEDFYDNLNEDNIKLLRSAFKGRISYIKAIPAVGINKRFMENPDVPVPGFKHYKVCASEMSEHQHLIYQKALEADLKDGTSAAYSNSLQASSFVGDDNKYQQVDLQNFKINFAGKDTVEKKLEHLAKYSKKYADSIRMILDPKNKNKNIFIFNKYIRGGGLNMFAYLLKSFGFGSVSGSDVNRLTPGYNRYILLTGDPNIDKTTLIERFNQDNNKNGEYIRVVLASDAISEGYTFKNVQVIDIHSPWFQFAKISQAIARGIRFGSHKALLETMDSVDVDIYLRVSVPPKNSLSDAEMGYGVDVSAYKTAEDKDVIVKRIEHIIKEESIDSRVNFARNSRPSEMDFTRDCDYMECKYKPFPFETDKITSKMDYSTFQLYYSDQSDMIDDIKDLFDGKLVMNLDEILKALDNNSLMVLSSLYNIIHSNVEIRDGLYLREQNNIYYLTNNETNNSSLSDIYYIKNSFDTAEIEEEEIATESVLSEILKDDSVNSPINLVNKFIQMNIDIDGREELLETVISEYIIKNVKTVQSEQVREYFSDLFGQIDGVWYSWYFISFKDKLCRKIDGTKWVDCTEDEENDIIIPFLRAKVDDVIERAKTLVDDENAKNIYYGLYDYADDNSQPKRFDKFLILNLDMNILNSGDRRTFPRGQECITFLNKEEKYQDIKDKLKIPDEVYYKLRNKYPNKLPKKSEGCEMIQRVMKDNNLIIRKILINRKEN